MADKHFHLSKEHRVIAGVCGGLAEYFETDPVLVRLIFLFFTLVGGSGILLYLILWVIMGGKHEIQHVAEEFKHDSQHHHEHTRGILGFFIIIVGVLILMDNLFPGFGVRTYWPLLLIFFGLAIMFRKHSDHHR